MHELPANEIAPASGAIDDLPLPYFVLKLCIFPTNPAHTFHKSSGLVLQGPIVDGSNEPAGGWLLIDVEQYELPLEPPANLNGWTWE
ncbi:hypothetical protein [Pseudomonas simiae]|uniref:hypothetical protein n=1 Tax=Pseudomonas simiae TaxID=321846 RepID=UPI0011857715|nr:hypothetical protein [Pseudomonas simiae]